MPDDDPWSPFSLEKNKVFLSLPSGPHTFEVKSRDRDFNEDPTPAAAAFTVVPPVWQQPWFIAMVVVLVSGIGVQTARVTRARRALVRELEAELQTAHDMQMALMPTESPVVEVAFDGSLSQGFACRQPG